MPSKKTARPKRGRAPASAAPAAASVAPSSDDLSLSSPPDEAAEGASQAKRLKTGPPSSVSSSSSSSSFSSVADDEDVPKVLFISFDDEKEAGGRKTVQCRLGLLSQGEVRFGDRKLSWRTVRAGETAEQHRRALEEQEQQKKSKDGGLEQDEGGEIDDAGATAALASEGRAVESSSDNSIVAMQSGSEGEGEMRLQLTYRNLHGAAEDGEDEGKAAVEVPDAGSRVERKLARRREWQAVQAHHKRTREIEAAIEENHKAFAELAKKENSTPDEFTAIGLERQRLEKELKRRRSADAEALYELRGEEWTFEVSLGAHVSLDGVPGNPSVVWAHVASADAGFHKGWQTTHSVSVLGAAAAGRDIDVGRLAYAKSIGSRGDGDGQFQSIAGVDVDEQHILACDADACSVSLFSKASGAFVRRFGSKGSGQGQFNFPAGVCLDGDNVYVCEVNSHRVQVLTKEGAFVRFIGDASGDGKLNGPVGVAMDEQHVYVSNFHGHFISVFSKASGAFIRKFGSEGNGQGQFNHLYGLCLDGDSVYVCDYGNHRVQVLTKAGVFVRFIGSADESAAGYLKQPTDVVVDEEHVFVADFANNCQSVRKGGRWVRAAGEACSGRWDGSAETPFLGAGRR